MEMVNALLILERTLSNLTIALACNLFQTLIELVQGPCHGNQVFLIGTNLCDIVARFIHDDCAGCPVAKVVELKGLCLKLLLAMVEGVQSDAIPRRIVFSLDLQQVQERYG